MNEKKISQVELGNFVGKTKSTVSSWIVRDVIPAGDIALKIAEMLHTPLEYLVTGEDPDNKEISDVRRKFLNFVNESSDEDLQKLWDFMMVMRGRE